MRELGFTSWLSRSMSLDSALARLSAAGCSRTEIAAMPEYLRHPEAVRSSVKEHDMSVGAVSLGPPFFYSSSKLDLHSPRETVRSESIRYVDRAIDLAAALEASMVYACSMSRGPTSKHEQALAFLGTAIAECSDRAEGAGIRFALEPFPTGELPSVVEANRFLLGTGAPKAGMVFDSGHAAISGERLSDAVRLSRERLIHVHLNNNDGVHDFHWRLEKGVLTAEEFSGLLIQLDRQAYRGEMSVELTKPGTISEAVQASRRFVDRLGSLG